MIRLLCEGYTNAQIAEDLGISVRTIESHRANVVQKLGRHCRADMVRLAREFHLMPKAAPQPGHPR